MVLKECVDAVKLCCSLDLTGIKSTGDHWQCTGEEGGG